MPLPQEIVSQLQLRKDPNLKNPLWVSKCGSFVCVRLSSGTWAWNFHSSLENPEQFKNLLGAFPKHALQKEGFGSRNDIKDYLQNLFFNHGADQSSFFKKDHHGYFHPDHDFWLKRSGKKWHIRPLENANIFCQTTRQWPILD